MVLNGFLTIKGGGFRKAGMGTNGEWALINWENDGGKEIKDYASSLYMNIIKKLLKSEAYYFVKSITWSDISGKNFAARACDEGFIFDVKGSSLSQMKKFYYFVLSFLDILS